MLQLDEHDGKPVVVRQKCKVHGCTNLTVEASPWCEDHIAILTKKPYQPRLF